MKQFLVLLCFVASFALSAQNGYPYTGSGCTPYVVDAWAFYKRQCVSYVAWCMNRDHGNTGTTGSFPFKNTMTGTGTDGTCNATSGQLSNACRWDDLLAAQGYFVSTTPTPGAIAQWNNNERTGIGSLGHVEYVISVNSDGTANTQSYNAAGTCAYKAYSNRSAPRYIRFSRMMLNSASLLPSTFVKGQAVKIQTSIKNNFNVAYGNVRIRAALYTSTNTFRGTIEEKTLNFAANETKTIEFSKSTITSDAGEYKIWIETQFSNGPWVLVHKHQATSTIPVNITTAALSVTPASLTFEHTANSKEISTSSTGVWTATDNASWLTLSSVTGTSTSVIRAICTANTSTTTSRTATITFTQSGVPNKTITVTQAAAPNTLEVSPLSFNLTATAGSRTINVMASGFWTVTDDGSWLTLSPTSGTGARQVTATYSSNTSTTISRTATITFRQNGLIKTILVTQSRRAALVEDNAQLIVLPPVVPATDLTRQTEPKVLMAPVLERVYPNPVANELSVVLNSSIPQEILFEIRTIDGKQVALNKHILSVGENRIQIPVMELANGFYFLAVYKEDKKTNVQLLKFEVFK